MRKIKIKLKPRFRMLPFPRIRFQRISLPNLLTLIRIALVVVFLALFLTPSVVRQWVALVVFLAAAMTDYFDGKIARERNLISNFGKIMDPLADKLMMLTAMICLVQVDVVPGWMVVIIWWRELAVTGLRTLVATHKYIMPADIWGKVKTVMQSVAVVAGLLIYTVQNTLDLVAPNWWLQMEMNENLSIVSTLLQSRFITYWLMFIAAVVSLISGMRYMRNNWRIISEELEEHDRLDTLK